MTWFTPYPPPADLDAVLLWSYVAASAGRHDLLPDGCMDLVWSADTGVVVCGPDTHGWSFEMDLGRPIAGVRFRAGAAAGVFRVDADSLVDRRVALADLVGARTARHVDEAVASAPDARGRTAVLESLVRRRADSLDALVDATVGVAGALAADPAAGVDDLAARAGLSARQLRRRFDRAVGYGPAFYARVVRLQRFAAAAMRRPDLGLAALAVAAGYGDQSHLAKDARAIAGRTPRELVATLGRSSLAVHLASDDDAASGRDRPGDPVDGRSVQDTDRRSRARWAA